MSDEKTTAMSLTDVFQGWADYVVLGSIAVFVILSAVRTVKR